ncbi:hypothetical protein GCM10010082_03160 [Kushneria pakistanensis]|uniref:Uncharacterized protein n=1 Tax=Kushneria pakistanensis TaxID=1508770 RepID=A0ABQ3FAA5_9GAMM|nr:hypothetical protein GCM10010082_03160 [Kushneria pakistanensis]
MRERHRQDAAAPVLNQRQAARAPSYWKATRVAKTDRANQLWDNLSRKSETIMQLRAID